MQSDYTLLRDIMRVYRDANPNWVERTDLLDRLPGRTAPDVNYHALILEEHGYVQVDKTETRTYDGTSTFLNGVRLSRPDVADQCLNPQPETMKGFRSAD